MKFASDKLPFGRDPNFFSHSWINLSYFDEEQFMEGVKLPSHFHSCKCLWEYGMVFNDNLVSDYSEVGLRYVLCIQGCVVH